MANITIVKLKVRRGSDDQRKQITLDQGEVGYTLDTRRLFVGDGTTLGGRVIGNTSIGPFGDIANLGPANSPGLQVGDIGYANSKLYRLTSFSYDDALSGYAYIGNVPDNTTIGFGTGKNENKLIVKKDPGGLDATYFHGNFFGEGLLSAGNAITFNGSTDYFRVSGNATGSQNIAPVIGSITQRELARAALGDGLSGGSLRSGADGTAYSTGPVTVIVNEEQFFYDSLNQGRITLKSLGMNTTIPISSWAGGVGDASKLGRGLTLNADGTIQAVAFAGDEVTTHVNSETGIIELINGLTTTGPSSDGTGNELTYPEVTDGLVTALQTSIYDVVTAIGLSGLNVGDSVPIGAIIPHSNAFTQPPPGYLLCNGAEYLIAEYQDLFNVIAQRFGNRAGNSFSVPNLTGGVMPGFLYGADQTPPTESLFLDGGTALDAGTSALSGLGVNYVIKYKVDPLRNIFNGSPDQVSQGLIGAQNNQVYECVNSAGNNIQLSSGGFITFALSGDVRNTASEGYGPNKTFNKFAIPVFNYI